MNLWQSINGMLHIEITSAEVNDTLEELNRHGIVFYQVRQIDPLTVRCVVRRTDFGPISAYCQKYGSKIAIITKRGIFWWLKRGAHRPVLVTSILLLLLLIFFLPTRIFFFSVDGNEKIPVNQILEAAENCGIKFGVSRRVVRSEKMKNALLSAIPELQWAGINTYGCRAVISVTERESNIQKAQSENITRMIASQDGMITSSTITNGTGMCSVGQTVIKDQLLISPYVDCGMVIKLVPVDGEIFANTNRKTRAITLSHIHALMQTSEIEHRYYLNIGKKRINLWKGSGISDSTCGRMYEEYFIVLPGGFRVPVCLGKETLVYRSHTVSEITEELAEQMLADYMSAYVHQKMIAGTILAEEYFVTKDADLWVLDACYTCNEMIGRIVTEETEK